MTEKKDVFFESEIKNQITLLTNEIDFLSNRARNDLKDIQIAENKRRIYMDILKGQEKK